MTNMANSHKYELHFLHTTQSQGMTMKSAYITIVHDRQ